jgi:hypothetical protein
VRVGTVVARRAALAARGDADAPQLQTCKGGAVSHVVRVIGRQAGVAHRARHAQPPEGLHRARRHVIALGARRLVVAPLLQQQHLDTALCQVDRQGQPDRARADHQHLRLVRLTHHRTHRSSFMYATMSA